MKQQHQEFVSFLEGGLIPDIKESGTEATAEDFERCCRIIKELDAKLELIKEVGDAYMADYDTYGAMGERLACLMSAIAQGNKFSVDSACDDDVQFAEDIDCLFLKDHPVFGYIDVE